MTVVLAVDPSLTATGWAHDNTTDWPPHQPVTTGLINTRPPTNEHRLLTIATQIRQLATRTQAEIVAIEGLAYGAKGRGLTDLAGLHWTIRNVLYGNKTPTIIVPSNVIKKYATGKGNAGKEEVLAAAIRRLNYTGHDNNIADALWLHATIKHALGQPVVNVPKTHLDALDTITLPTLTPTS